MLAVLLGATAARSEETVGSVAALEGSAEAVHAGRPGPVPLRPADAVLLDDRLHTAERSKLKLLFRDDSVLTLAASSDLTVTRQLAGPASTNSSYAVVGTVRAVVTDRYKTPGSTFEVETPTAIAGVRGTSFIVRYDPAERVTLVVDLAGTVCVWPRVGRATAPPVCLQPKQFTEVSAGRRPGEAAPVEPGLLQAVLDATEIPGGGIEPERELGPEGPLEPVEPRTGRTEPEPLAAPDRPGEDAYPRDKVVDQPIPELLKPRGGGPSPTLPPPTLPPPTTPPPTTPPPTTPAPTTPPPTLPPPTTPPPTQPRPTLPPGPTGQPGVRAR